MKIRDLMEAEEKKTKTKVKSKVDLSGFSDKDILGDQKPSNVSTAYKKADISDDEEDEPKPKAPRTVSKEKTAAATANVRLDQKALDRINSLKMDAFTHEDDPVDNEVSTHVKATNVPAMVSSAMKAAGFIDPDFHLVSNLPGNMSSAIKQLGKALFRSLTTTPTDNISMVGSLGGNGPNSKQEINAVAAYAKKEGKDLGPGEIDFDAIMPGYKAKIHNFAAGGVHFMMVKDDHGEYIYSWPENTSVTASNGHKAIAAPAEDAPRSSRRPRPTPLKLT